MEKNLTTGSVFKTLLSFSLPYLLSYFLQTLYGMADLFIIGQYNGVESTTAVSIGSQVMHMLTVMIVGLAMGGTVMIGQAVGAGERKKASKAIGNTISLFLSISFFLTLILLILVKPITSVMSTPEEAVPGTISYLRICFIGIPLITAYNIISAIFRGLGDSKSPMIFIAIACAANIALDYLFIGMMSLGPAGAALATTIAQTISVISAFLIIRKRKDGIPLSTEDLKPDRSVMSGLLKVGVPVALQDGFIQISFIVITIIVNMRGLNDAAAVGIVEKLISILFLVPSSMLQTVSALCAQNIGAEKHERARLTLRYAIIIAVCWGILINIIMRLFSEPIIGMFTSSAEVTAMGCDYMRGYVWDCIFAGIHFCFSGYFYAYKLSAVSFLHNAISILFARIPLSYLASKRFPDSLYPMGLATSAGSLLSVIVCLIVYIWMRRSGKTGKKDNRSS